MVVFVADTPSTLPSFVNWPSFPFEGQLRTKRLDAAVSVEPPREGEDPESCIACNAPEEAYIWVSERWRVRAMDRPSGLPMVLILESRSHLDLGDLPNLLAAELGVMTVRLERAIRSLDGVARVHVNRWGDGAAHLHLWFLARPVGRLQLRGSFLSLWDDILEPIPEAQWRENLALIAAWLAEFGGRPLAEPSRIIWHAPSRFADPSVATEAIIPTPFTHIEKDEDSLEELNAAIEHMDGPRIDDVEPISSASTITEPTAAIEEPTTVEEPVALPADESRFIGTAQVEAPTDEPRLAEAEASVRTS